MRLIFLCGMPATGKLTVAREIAARTGCRLFHNHLVVDLLLSTFAFGSEPFVTLREEIWLSVLGTAARSEVPAMIFTFNPERSVREGFAERAEAVVVAAGGTVNFVELVCPLEEIRRRIDAPSRLEYRKLSSISLFEELERAGEFDTSYMPTAEITVDTGSFKPMDAARVICEALGLVAAG